MQPPPGDGGEGTYHAFYNDQSKYPHQGDYKVVMAGFEVSLENPALFTPHQLAIRVYQSGDQGLNMFFILHCPPDDAPAEAQGYFNVYHVYPAFPQELGCSPHLGMTSLSLSKVMWCNSKRPHPLFGIQLTSIQSYK
jgi:hypothetical protein